MTTSLNNVSSKAVEKATGKSWDGWIKLLDRLGAERLSHKELAKMLNSKYIGNGWWAQMVTVGYEYAKGKRVVGQTGSSGFEIGVQKMIPVEKERLWKFLISSRGQEIWLGKGANLKVKVGEIFETENGMQGQIRTLSKGEKLRLNYKKRGIKPPSTLQISLFCPRNRGDRTNLRFHQEKLESASEREKMRKHWQKVLTKIDNTIGK